MTLAEALAVLDRWAHCRCSCTRAPTDPCRCMKLDTVKINGGWCCQGMVSDHCDKITSRDRAENRKP